MKPSSIFFILAVALLAVSTLAQPVTPGVQPSPPIEPIIQVPFGIPVPEEVLTPSTGTIFFTVYSEANCSTESVYFNATVNDDYPACQAFPVGNGTYYVHLACYSNSTAVGAVYMDSTCQVEVGTWPQPADSGVCAPMTTSPGPDAVAVVFYCPNDPLNPSFVPINPEEPSGPVAPVSVPVDEPVTPPVTPPTEPPTTPTTPTPVPTAPIAPVEPVGPVEPIEPVSPPTLPPNGASVIAVSGPLFVCLVAFLAVLL